MNVKDIQVHLSSVHDDRLLLMLEQQKQLMEKYHDIEKGMRLTPDCPVDLDDRHGQLLLKDFAWRTTEELAEALSALKENHYEAGLHAQEEVADALHFLLEFIILADGMKYMSFKHHDKADRLEFLFNTPPLDWLQIGDVTALYKSTMETIRQLGMVCHTLKNKPWKQTHMLTDKNEFYLRLRNTLGQFCQTAWTFGMGPQELFEMYFRKAAVNEFRQRSAY